MANLIDYLTWRGDLPFERISLNEVDNLVLSQLSNYLWQEGLGDETEMTLRDLYERMKTCEFAHGICAENDKKLMPMLAQSERFGGIRVCHYEEALSEVEDKQFAAVTLCLPDGTSFISYRGTDCSLVGWKEDCNLCLPEPIPAQVQAADYLVRVMQKMEGSFYVGGHSKGGNLAMYACAVAPQVLQDRILALYSNDGPGLSDAVFCSEGYRRIESKLHALVPQESIIGMLMAHPEQYSVIHSNSVSIFQHNPYSWQLEQGHFIHEEKRRKESVYIEHVLKKWLGEISAEERKVFIDTLFEVLGASESKLFGMALWVSILKNPKAVISTMQNLTPASRQRLTATLTALAAAAIDNDYTEHLLNIGKKTETSPAE